MKIVSWNINGIRATRNGVKEMLDSLDGDIICLQETKVTRDLLDEPTAVVEGYNSYFSFSRGRSGYSGVATFCRDNATPLAAEEGLSGLLTNHTGAVCCYGDTEEFSEEELQGLDNEGRAVITRHKIITREEQEETLTVINVYCPRADPEKPERKTYKLRFYHLLQARAEAILRSGGHVIILGDVNTSHRIIDTCDPKDPEFFEDNPGRKWLNQFLVHRNGDATGSGSAGKEEESPLAAAEEQTGGLFLDSFRFFHPTQQNAFTCWCTNTGARLTNYGSRIDYIFGDRALVENEFEDSVLMPEVEGSDHCPVKANLRCRLVAAPKCPALCTKYLPEFAGKQQKLSQFLVKIDRMTSNHLVAEEKLQSSQNTTEALENRSPAGDMGQAKVQRKQWRTDTSKKGAKRQKTDLPSGQASLLGFFKPANAKDQAAKATVNKNSPKIEQCQDTKSKVPNGNCAVTLEEPAAGGTPEFQAKPQADFWKTLLKGPAPPPVCKGHSEPCVLRTVKKEGPNCGKQFYVCARPEGFSSNPDARCNFFLWVSKKVSSSR
ncbi:DNA-(apurinic or apyrimidinic site) endonuclease 2 isoform X2 [Ambystoma mexicanum]|uniref:DNA-(apurinic or apyrimidinic site) endonuclease 2 isoform X2 n=1 Tax=Ambystoma mexicanum TaxID=8296 RepID=UPI0037E9B7D5